MPSHGTGDSSTCQSRGSPLQLLPRNRRDTSDRTRRRLSSTASHLWDARMCNKVCLCAGLLAVAVRYAAIFQALAGLQTSLHQAKSASSTSHENDHQVRPQRCRGGAERNTHLSFRLSLRKGAMGRRLILGIDNAQPRLREIQRERDFTAQSQGPQGAFNPKNLLIPYFFGF